jgi:lysophospholipase
MTRVAALMRLGAVAALALAGLFAAHPASAQAGAAYRGDEASFAAFVAIHQRTDWPAPQRIGWFDPSGGGAPVIRYAHWVPQGVAPVGTVVHFSGRTEFIEKAIDTYADLLRRGYAVWTLDWRGQGFSQRPLADKQRHHIDGFDTYVADATYFIDRVVRLKDAPGRKVLMAHSMGGQIALRYLLSPGGAEVFDQAVLGSPLVRIPGDAWWLRMGNRLKVAVGLGAACVLGKPEAWESNFAADRACAVMRGANPSTADLLDPPTARLYSNDVRRLAAMDCLTEASRDANGPAAPDLRLACPSSGWLQAAFDSTDEVMRRATTLRTPTLIVRAVPDALVDNDGQTEFCALAKIDCVSIGRVGDLQAGHELLIEAEPIRQRFLQAFDDFVGRGGARQNPGP